MTKNQHSRRNFLSCLAILSAGTAFGSVVSPLDLTNKKEDTLEKNWDLFWKSAGGQVFTEKITSAFPQLLPCTSGHHFENGDIILLKKYDVLAQPTWIFWGDDKKNPKDVVITVFENTEAKKKITRLNRFEMDAIYKLSQHFTDDQLLLTSHSATKPLNASTNTFIQNKTSINRHSNTQLLSYFKEQSLVFHKKIIYNV